MNRFKETVGGAGQMQKRREKCAGRGGEERAHRRATQLRSEANFRDEASERRGGEPGAERGKARR